jgi:hypothetical protein
MITVCLLQTARLKFTLLQYRSYLGYYDIYIIPAKFKQKVKMPKVYRVDEEAIDAKDIRDILLLKIWELLTESSSNWQVR